MSVAPIPDIFCRLSAGTRCYGTELSYGAAHG